MASYAEILRLKYPGVGFQIDGDNYSSLVWHSDKIKKPTEKKIKSLSAAVDNMLVWERIRKRRNKLLADCDWTELPSVRAKMDPKKAQEWDKYRQTLRDIPQFFSEPEFVFWPDKP